jgi:pimeloyl-ACP methyl ester carboxylesterase
MNKHRVIMLPGWGMPPNVWLPLTDNLSLYFDLCLVDWDDVQSIDGFHAKVLAIVFAQPDRRFSILGWFLGWLVALAIAAEYPDKIARLILFGGTSRFTSDKAGGYYAGWPLKMVEKMKANLEQDQENTLRDFYSSMFSGIIR